MCSSSIDNEIILNHDAVKLSFTLIDYIVVHALMSEEMNWKTFKIKILFL